LRLALDHNGFVMPTYTPLRSLPFVGPTKEVIVLNRRVLNPLVRRPVRLAAAGLAIAVVAAAALIGVSDSAEGRDRTVRTEGSEQYVPNAKIMSTLRFTPGHIIVNSGDELTLEHSDRTEEPHTLSIVDANEVPSTSDDVFNCGSPGTVCEEIFNSFPAGPPPPSAFVDAPGTGVGLDGRLDSLFVEAGASASAQVTAPSGTTLHFICAIHAWMQGDITVK